MISFAQGKLRVAVQGLQVCAISHQLIGKMSILDRAEDTRAERLQPWVEVDAPIRVQCDDGPDAAGWSPQEEPAQGLTRFKIEIGRGFKIIEKQKN